jgi:hypothetical protein
LSNLGNDVFERMKVFFALVAFKSRAFVLIALSNAG